MVILGAGHSRSSSASFASYFRLDLVSIERKSPRQQDEGLHPCSNPKR